MSAHHITKVPIKVIINGKVRYDSGTDANQETMYSGFIRDITTDSVQTEPPSVGEFMQIYQNLCLHYDVILSIHVADKFMDVVKNAKAAAFKGIEQFRQMRAAKNILTPLQIRVIDSKSISVGLGLLVLRAAELAQTNTTVTPILVDLERLAEQISVFVMVDDITYMRAGGHDKKMSLFSIGLGALLDSKPILSFAKGDMTSIDKARGYEGGIDLMSNLIKEKLRQKKSYNKIGILYGGKISAVQDTPRLAAFRQEMTILGFTTFMASVCPSLGFYAGHRCLGFALMNDDVS